jgi:DNA-binding MarR family transcriptional regulator
MQMKSTDQLPPANPMLSDHLCFLIYSANLGFVKASRPRLDELGLTNTKHITIIALWEEDNQTVSGLGEKLFSRLQHAYADAEEARGDGLSGRQHDPKDERQVCVRLTRYGRKLREKALTLDLSEATALAPDKFARVQKTIVSLRINLIKSVQNGVCA